MVFQNEGTIMPERFESRKKARKLKKEEAKKARSSSSVSVKKKYLFLTEGATEKIYIDQFFLHHQNESIDAKGCLVEQSKYTNPKDIVNEAVEIFRQKPEFDAVFTIFDRDSYHLTEHNDFATAIRNANETKLPARLAPNKKLIHADTKLVPIYSIPSFELWFLLSFEYSTRTYPKTGKKSFGDYLIDNHLRDYFPNKTYDKTYLDNFKIVNHNQIADLRRTIANAKRLKRHCEQSQCEEPQTEMGFLMELLLTKDDLNE